MAKNKKKKTAAANQVSPFANVLLNIALLIGVLICIYPVLQVIGISFSDNEAVKRTGYSIIPKVFSLTGYQYVFSASGAIVKAYGVTIFATVVGTLIHVIMVSMFAYPLTRPEFAYRNFYMLFILVPTLFSGGMVPWYIVCTQLLHLKNTIWALIVPLMFNSWNTIMLRTFIKNTIPDSLIESARLDGSSEFSTYIRIVLPLSKAGLATIGFMVALGFWNDWYQPLMLVTDERLYNLQYLLYKIMNQIQHLANLAAQNPNEALMAMDKLKQIPQETARMAMCVVTVGPIIFAYPFFQRFFVKGMTVGAVKG